VVKEEWRCRLLAVVKFTARGPVLAMNGDGRGKDGVLTAGEEGKGGSLSVDAH
jgi:hypothetical protein